MKNLSLYSSRFRAIETVAYFMLPVPWLPDLLRGSALPYGAVSLVVKIVLTAAVLAFIAGLRDLRKKINSLDTLKQDLAMSAIHDLKGPLTSIIGALAIISEPDMDQTTRDKLLRIAAQDSKSMVRLIQMLVDTERMEIAKLILQPRRFDLGEHLKSCLEMFVPLSVEMGVKLDIVLEDGLPPILADSDLLGRVYQNLVMNSLKYSRKSGEIQICAGFSEGWFHFKIKDTGLGIAAEHIKDVFEKYYRVEGEEHASRKSSGLGLYFCRLAIEAHGGRIWVESAEGKGTSLLFTLPENGKPPASQETGITTEG